MVWLDISYVSIQNIFYNNKFLHKFKFPTNPTKHSTRDGNVGRVVSALKAKNMYDNTFIFAFSDNGGDVRTGASNHPYRGDKMSVWEGGTRSPAFIHSPNPNIIPENIRGTDSEALGHAVDLFPTAL